MIIGSGAGQNLTTGSNNVDIANPGVAGDSGAIRIGSAGTQTAAFLQGVWNKTIAGPTQAVVVNANGRLGTGPPPAAPAAKTTSGTVGRLRAQNRRQSAELRRLSVGQALAKADARSLRRYRLAAASTANCKVRAA